MRPVLDGIRPESALDVGCNRGFFTLSIASSGVPAIGVETDPPAYRDALYAIRRAGIANAGVLVMEITPTSIAMLPSADCVVFLSLWHHFVRAHGFQTATDMLAMVWQRSRKVLFFDTGEKEMPSSFGLPAMDPTPKEWLERHLSETCSGGRALSLGQHQAYAPDGSSCKRNLFAVVRAGVLDGDAT